MKRISVTKDNISKDRFYDLCREVSATYSLELDDLYLWKDFFAPTRYGASRLDYDHVERVDVCVPDHVYVIEPDYEVLLSFTPEKEFNFGTGHFYYCER